jgi:hypothetical protein
MAYDYRPNTTAGSEMTSTRTTRRAVPGWLAAVLAATTTLIALGFIRMGFFVSVPGLAIAGGIAIGVGSIVGAIVDPPHGARHAGVVAFYVVALAAAYLLVLQNLARLDQQGVTSGAGVERPLRSGGPGVYPPSR